VASAVSVTATVVDGSDRPPAHADAGGTGRRTRGWWPHRAGSTAAGTDGLRPG
jgi:hypothetical protein